MERDRETETHPDRHRHAENTDRWRGGEQHEYRVSEEKWRSCSGSGGVWPSVQLVECQGDPGDRAEAQLSIRRLSKLICSSNLVEITISFKLCEVDLIEFIDI